MAMGTVSQIAFLPEETGTFIRVRINGTVYSHDKPLCSKQVHEQVISRLKVLAELDTTNHTTPQDGAFKVPLPHGMAYVRLALMPTVHGERAVLRLMHQRAAINIPGLGLHPAIEHMIRDVLDRTEGAIICAGPTGSGKTTTLYSLLSHLTTQPLNLVSIEDPVEIHLAGVSQTQLNEKAKLTYAACLKSVLRHDPDVILVGEIRDSESASVALQAAITGHLLLTTVHARGVYEVLLRLQHLGIDPLTIGQGVSLIISQKLIPTLCPHCKVEDTASSSLMRHSIYKAIGCLSCNRSGFSGLALAAEALLVDPAIANILSTRPHRGELEAHYTPANYLSLETSLESLLQQGRIPIEIYLQNLDK
jgi:type II secretory ATPase GspE/PulE/Tfp pilus assembly ATPase PilB-like protein